MGRKRFPRLATPKPALRSIAQLLRLTYNRIAQTKSFRLSRIHYDIYRTKRGENAEHNFLLLADRLAQEPHYIDPALYLSVLCRYGKFSSGKYLPPPGWLSSDKARDIFDWLSKKEREKYPKNEDWRKNLKQNSLISMKRLRSSIKSSWKTVKLQQRAFGMGVAEAVILQAQALSPWFLAICVPFLKAGGLQALEDRERNSVKKRILYLTRKKVAFHVACSTYRKLKPSRSIQVGQAKREYD